MKEIVSRLENEYNNNKPVINDEEEKELEFLTAFLNKATITNINSLIDMDKKDFLLAVLSSFDLPEITFSQLQEDIDKLTNINTVDNSNYFVDVLRIIFKFKDNGLIDELANIPLLSNEDGAIEDIVTAHKREYVEFYNNQLIDDLSVLHIKLLKGICKSEEERFAFFDLLKNHTNEMITALIGIATVLTLKEDIEENKSRNYRRKDFDAFVSKKLNNTKLLSTFKRIEERKNKLYLKKKERTKKENSMVKRLNTIKEELKKWPSMATIDPSPTFLALIENSDTKFLLLKYALLHNRETYQNTKNKLIADQSISAWEKLFKSYSLDFDILLDEEKELLTTYGDIETVNKMLNVLKERKFKFLFDEKSSIGEILLLSNFNNISTISGLLTQGLLSENFIKDNLDIFYDDIDDVLARKLNKDKGKFSILLQNVNVLKSRKINVKRASLTNPNVLVDNNLELVKKLENLDCYGLNFQKAKNLDLIENPNLISYLDKFIELGLYNYVKEHPCIIDNNVNNIINRILFCRQLDIEVFDGKKLNDLVLGKVFKVGKMVISDDTIAQCINNQTFITANMDMVKILLKSDFNDAFEKEEINELEPYKLSDQLYDFDGVLISRNKVLRNYSVLKGHDEFEEKDIIFNSLIFGSILDIDSQDKIKNIVFKDKKMKELKL